MYEYIPFSASVQDIASDVLEWAHHGVPELLPTAQIRVKQCQIYNNVLDWAHHGVPELLTTVQVRVKQFQKYYDVFDWTHHGVPELLTTVQIRVKQCQKYNNQCVPYAGPGPVGCGSFDPTLNFFHPDQNHTTYFVICRSEISMLMSTILFE